MKKLPINQTFPDASAIAYGCMGLGGGWGDQPYNDSHVKQAHQVIDTSLQAGINFFDHADIYTSGKAEKVFGEVLSARPELREQIILQSKCGIQFADDQGPKRFSAAKNDITEAVDGILSRLKTDYIDILLLHRPDPLMNPEEVAMAFNALKASGKVKQFGVSNVNGNQLHFLQHYLDMPLVANQLELHLLKLDWLDEVVLVNDRAAKDLTFTSGTLEYCRMHNVQLQSWGTLSQGFLSGRSLDGQPKHVHQTAALVADLAAQYQTSPEAIVLAFLMRHPAGIQPIIGTTDPQRIIACSQANKIELSRGHWYALYVCARGEELP